MVLRGRQCCASVVAKAHLVGGGVRARVFRRDLREHPGAHYEMCARPRSGAIFGHIHACDIRCLRSAVLQPPGRTPAMVARGTRASFFGEGDALRPMACPARGRSAPFVVLRAVPWRRILSYASLLCRRNGLRAWRPARLREGASCGWRRSRKGVPTGSARTPRGTLRDVRKEL